MSGYGHTGPHAWTSMNMNLQGYSGLMTVTGAEGDPPTAISNSWNDYIGGLHACFAVQQALAERAATGKGSRLDLSQFECSVSMIGPLLLASALTAVRQQRAWVTARSTLRLKASIAAPETTTGARSAYKTTGSGKL